MVDRKIRPNGEGPKALRAGVLKLDIGSWIEKTFEDKFLRKAFFLGENDLDRVLLSLHRHISDGKSSIEDFEGKTILINRVNFEKKIRLNPNKSIRFRYNLDKEKRDFSHVSFARRFGIPLDTILGEYPFVFTDGRVLFHSLKLSYALYLTMKMFKVHDQKTFQRTRGKRFFLKSSNLLTLIFLNIFSKFKVMELDEKSMIKCIKNSLCLMVSQAMNQVELPEGASITLFPDPVWRHITKSLSKDDLVRFSFSCLQSKVLCQCVPEEFILETLIKHQQQLGSPHRGMSPKILSELEEKGREFGKIVKRFYKPNDGFFPSNKATFAFPRNMGGVKGDLVYSDCLKDLPNREDPEDRMEPFVLGLFGQPGAGKSTLINRLVNEFSFLFPGVPSNKLVYQRTCHVEHWDGYDCQPIVVFDDIGQSTDGHDIKEFQTLVSCCPYVLPMAELSEKGKKFCSPIIICTSNLNYGSNLQVIYDKKAPIIDDASFWRRFTFPIYVENQKYFSLKTNPYWVRKENLLFGEMTSFKRMSTCGDSYFKDKKYFGQEPEFRRDSVSSNKWEIFDFDFERLRTLFRDRRTYHENFRQTWIQTVIDKTEDTEMLNPLLEEIENFGFTQSFDFKSGAGVTKSLNFPAYPPPGPLKVRVEPIVEPLKVRTITAGEGSTFCLKPFQRAMWLALGEFPQYCLTHGTNKLEPAIDRIFQDSGPNDVWISGDYTAATDSFSLEGSQALMRGILESIPHEPTKRWAMKELSPHLLVYPKKSGLKPTLQRSGQLMGSLLSFPLLCLLNDCTAQSCGLSPESYLINGDDILMRAPESIYPLWKEKVEDFGLELSLGKNYIHKRYGTINSQIIIDGTVRGSGKQRLLDRRSQVLGECLRDLELAMPEEDPSIVQELFKTVNYQKLSRTVRSISVPVSHGGLAFSWGTRVLSEKSQKTAILCYLNDLFKKLKPQKGCISIPYLSIEEKNISKVIEEERIFNFPSDSKEFHEDFLRPIDLSYTSKRCMTNSNLREILLNQDLRNLPSLNYIRTYQIPCDDLQVKKQLQVAVDQLFLSGFLQGGQEFGYDSWRENFLHVSQGLPLNNKTLVKHIVSLMDLNVSIDFLHYVNLNFQTTEFSKELFEKNLGKSLKPKEFDLPEDFDGYVDQTEEVYRSFEGFCIRNGLTSPFYMAEDNFGFLSSIFRDIDDLTVISNKEEF